MTKVAYKRWVLHSDVAATREAYRALELGGPEECDCASCRNFIALRDQVYPPEVRALFDHLGVDYTKAVEVSHMCRLDDTGLHFLWGWMHFVGHIESGKDTWAESSLDLEQVDAHFKIGFTKKLALVDRPFAGKPLVQIDFYAEVPWILDDEEDFMNPT